MLDDLLASFDSFDEMRQSGPPVVSRAETSISLFLTEAEKEVVLVASTTPQGTKIQSLSTQQQRLLCKLLEVQAKCRIKLHSMDIGLYHLFNQQGQRHDSPKVRAMLYKHELQEMNHKLKDLFGDIYGAAQQRNAIPSPSLLIDDAPRAARNADNQVCPNRVL